MSVAKARVARRSAFSTTATGMRRREDPGHRPDGAVVMAGREVDLAALGEPPGGLRRVAPSPRRGRRRSPRRAWARTSAPTRWAGPRAGSCASPSPGSTSRGGAHVDEPRARGEDALRRPRVGRGDARADRVVGIVLEPREQEAEVAIAAGGRAPVELDDGGAVRRGASANSATPTFSARIAAGETARLGRRSLHPAAPVARHVPVPRAAREPRGEPRRLARCSAPAITPAAASAASWRAQVLRIGRGAAHRGDDGDGRAALAVARARVGEGGRERAAGSGWAP